ncbi:S41 family peptidase [Fibrella aquatilis]|uniref:Tail specific protease domain-containing protein n=1 Tax=Fibrella aquatilis TaxID=2817059 RepID=A0A939FZ56_9BACT|nr:S41 family peptidase [Fibrella aquatilis]MBO0929427.1 hypothetical protein [Fibrella aquatilis]
MHRLLLVLLLLPTLLLAQPVTYTPAQVERVAKLSELYGHIKFFHPYLGYKPINWDSAFAVAAPLVAQAKTDEETATALRQLLAVLNDDATTVQVKNGATPAATTKTADTVQVYFGPDSTLVLTTNNYANVNATNYEGVMQTLNLFVRQLPKARAVRLDLRSERPIPAESAGYFSYMLDEADMAKRLASSPLLTPGKRLRQHSGFAPEQGSSSGGYWSGFYLRGGTTSAPMGKPLAVPVQIAVNKQTEFSDELYALRSQPHVRFSSDGPLSDALLVPTTTFTFNEAVSVRFRTGELVNADGTIGIAAAPATLPTAPPPVTYPAGNYPSLGYRLLAGAKIWSVIHYFFAYKELMPTNWTQALHTAVGELAAATDSTQYALSVARFYRHVQDSHGFIGGATSLRYYAGSGGVLVDVRFIDEKPVITRVYADSLRAKGLLVGDIITSVNGEPIQERIARMAAIQPASNEWTRRRNLANRLLRSPAGSPIRIGLLGANGKPKTVSVTSLEAGQLQNPPDTGRSYRLLPGNIGYAHMGRLQGGEVAAMFEAFKQTKALIFDMRNYPNGTAWAITPYLTDRKNVVGAKFVRYSPNQPLLLSGDEGGTTQKTFFDQQIPGNTGQRVYRGKTVMLIDERTQSQAEHSGLFFEAANGTEFIGSPTAGANGDVTNFAIPGGITLSFSGHDVRHADGRQLQQVGLQPKILVRPTLSGIRAGKDEVLDRAVQYLTVGK